MNVFFILGLFLNLNFYFLFVNLFEILIFFRCRIYKKKKKKRKILCICNLVKEFYINSKNNCILIDVLIFLVVYIKIFFLMLKILIELYDY